MARRRVAIRELRQNLSVHLRKVEKGETLEVTDRGRPVAILAPLPEASSALARLYAEGRLLQLPRGRVTDLPPPLKVKPRMSSRRALEGVREDRI